MAARIKNVKEYIREKDSSLADWIDEHIFDDSMFNSPVTFILPDEATRSSIVSSSTPEDGIAILKSYVIPGVSLKRYASFMPNGDLVITYADHVLDVRHVDSQGVRIGPSDIRVDAAFTNNDDASVYYARGPLPTTGEVATFVDGSAQRRRRVHGRGDGSTPKRQALTEFIERRYRTYLYKRALFPKKLKCVNPYLEFVVNFFMYLKSSPSTSKYAKLAYILDCDPAASYYILIEPYHVLTPGFQYLIPDDILDGYDWCRVYGNIFEQYYDLFKELTYSADYVEQRNALVSSQARMRSAGTEIYKSCDAQYEALFNNSGQLRAFPREVLDLIGTPQKKKWQDIFRCRFPCFYSVFTRDGEGGDYIHVSELTLSQEFNKFRNHIKTACCYDIADVKMKNFPVKEPVTAMLNFCKSCCFLYSAPTLNEIKNPQSECCKVYEVVKAANGEFDRLKGLARDLAKYKAYQRDPGFSLGAASPA